MKGVILAGGQGSRLYPLTRTTSKQLLAVYDKPMIYYPLSILMLSGIQEMMIITTPSDYSLYKALLGDGSQFGCRFSYGVQPKPRGLPEAFLIAEKFIGKERVALILGDNIFYGAGLGGILRQVAQKQGHFVWAYRMEHPESYGVVALDENNKPISIEEKPTRPRSPYVLVGLYFYESEVVAQAKTLRPSERGRMGNQRYQRLFHEERDFECGNTSARDDVGGCRYAGPFVGCESVCANCGETAGA